MSQAGAVWPEVMMRERGEGRQKPAGKRSLVLIVATLSLLLTLFAPLGSRNVAAKDALGWSAPRTVYMPEPGHTLDDWFLDLWRNGGGASAFGYPITPEITLANGHVIQYMQYARFEYWPEGDADGNQMLLGKIGEELRPISVPRTMASFSSRGQEGESGGLSSLVEAKAWIPLPTDPAPDDKSFVYVKESQHTIRGSFLSFWYDTGSDGYLGNPLTEEYTINDVTYQIFERGQLEFTEADGVSLVPVGKILADKYQLDQAAQSQGDLPAYDPALFIPPPSGPQFGPIDPNLELWLDVDLTRQYMVVYNGDNVVAETYVSTGRPGYDTPTGTFYVSVMMPFDDMEGVLGGEYYNVPQVPDVMYFTGEGHAIHGTYWHNNFGHVMSHGCVNLPMDVADWLYANAHIGMRVVIHY
jgi:hypothetical protein